MRLTKKIAQLGKKYPTPCLLIDLQEVRKNYRRIKHSIDNVEVFYAMKANNHPKVLEILAQEGSSFEVSSLNEMKDLISLDVPGSKIICLNPIKKPDFLEEMKKYGVEIMAYDSTNEVDKIAMYAPGSKLVLRITVDNEGSDWPLTKKFGVDAAEALPLLEYAQKKKLQPIGLTFHVGSQCLNKNNWASALYICDDIWNQAKGKGIHLNFISLGGGIPIQHLKTPPTVKEIGDTINKVLKGNFKAEDSNLRITIEPGRGLIGDAAIMITQVIGKVKRGNEDWIYIDAGVFNGLMETIEGFMYEVKTERLRKKEVTVIAGPSCDSVDIPFKNALIPNVRVGDYLYIINAGAYTTVYASTFNGFEPPQVFFLND